ncbi:hypothetical protein ACWCHM_16150 [Micromonospora sp. SCSIO 07396]
MIGDAPAVTVTSAWKPPAQELVMVYFAVAWPAGGAVVPVGVGVAVGWEAVSRWGSRRRRSA